MSQTPIPRQVERSSYAVQAQAYLGLVCVVVLIFGAFVFDEWSPEDRALPAIAVASFLVASATGTLSARSFLNGRVHSWLLAVLTEATTLIAGVVGLAFVAQFSALLSLLMTAMIISVFWLLAGLCRTEVRRFFFTSRSVQ